MNKKLVGINIAIAAALTFGTAIAANTQQEKCYGIAKAGMNDCATATESCSGSATKDRQPDAFLFVPEGLCTKISGGNLKMKTENKT